MCMWLFSSKIYTSSKLPLMYSCGYHIPDKFILQVEVCHPWASLVIYVHTVAHSFMASS